MFNIIPQPSSVLINQSNKGFTLHAGTIISPFDFCEDFIDFCRKVFNKKVHIHEDTGEERSIILTLDDAIEHDEGYTLKCENRRVYINAKTELGLFYGLQTLKQLLLQTEGKIPYTEIKDEPRFSYRGFTLDCEKYFYTVGELKRIASLFALHKFNSFNLIHKGYYTQEDIKELVKYCDKKKIHLVTENERNKNNFTYRLDYPYGMNTLKNVCDSNEELYEASGIEILVNTAHIPDLKRFEYLLFPRLEAIAENGWAESDYPSFSTFLHKSIDCYKLLEVYNVNAAPIKKACPSFIYKHTSSIAYKIKAKKQKLKN